MQECQQQILRGNMEDLSANLTLIVTKLKKRNKLIKSADQLPVGWSILQEYEQDSIDAQKIRQNKAIRKRKVKAPTSFTQSTSSTIAKAPSFQFWDASFRNGSSLPISTKRIEYNSNNPFSNLINNPFNNPFRPTRTPKSSDNCMGCRE